jgi:hypothetical protein
MVIASIENRLKEMRSNIDSLDSKDFNTLTTIELLLKEINIFKQ